MNAALPTPPFACSTADNANSTEHKHSRVEKGPCVMSIQEVAPEQLAELFHHYHQALAPDFALRK